MDYTMLASKDVLDKTVKAIEARNVTVQVVADKEAALSALRALLPDGAELNTAGSTTLEQIGFIDLLKSKQHPWKNVKDEILAEKDPAKQGELRKRSIAVPYFIGSVHAVTQDGQLVFASATGSQIPGYSFASDHVVWVVGAHKIVPTLADAFKRLEEHCIPLEDQRMKSTGAPGTLWGHTYIFNQLAKFLPRKMHLIFVNEVLGF